MYAETKTAVISAQPAGQKSLRQMMVGLALAERKTPENSTLSAVLQDLSRQIGSAPNAERKIRVNFAPSAERRDPNNE